MKRIFQQYFVVIFVSVIMSLGFSAAEQLPRAPRGIQNIGNSCYMNASLQCLYQLKSLTGLMLSNDISYNPQTLGEAYQQFVRQYSGETNDFLNPYSLYARFPHYLAGGNQQDAEEATSYLINKLEEDQSAIVKKQSLPFTFETQDVMTCQLCRQQRQGNPVQNRLLTLSLPEDAFLLQDLLDAYFGPAEVENIRCTNPDCDWFGQLLPSQKQIYIEQLPQVLCIGLKRFSFDAETGSIKKLTNPITLPLDGLKLSQYCPSCPNDVQQQRYSLEGIVLHSGTDTQGGHYVAVVKHANQWYFCNDTEIRMLKQQELDGLLNTGDLTLHLPGEVVLIDGELVELPSVQSHFYSYLVFYSRSLSTREMGKTQHSDEADNFRAALEVARLEKIEHDRRELEQKRRNEIQARKDYLYALLIDQGMSDEEASKRVEEQFGASLRKPSFGFNPTHFSSLSRLPQPRVSERPKSPTPSLD